MGCAGLEVVENEKLPQIMTRSKFASGSVCEITVGSVSFDRFTRDLQESPTGREKERSGARGRRARQAALTFCILIRLETTYGVHTRRPSPPLFSASDDCIIKNAFVRADGEEATDDPAIREEPRGVCTASGRNAERSGGKNSYTRDPASYLVRLARGRRGRWKRKREV